MPLILLNEKLNKIIAAFYFVEISGNDCNIPIYYCYWNLMPKSHPRKTLLQHLVLERKFRCLFFLLKMFTKKFVVLQKL